jgi:hypothetical protein
MTPGNRASQEPELNIDRNDRASSSCPRAADCNLCIPAPPEPAFPRAGSNLAAAGLYADCFVSWCSSISPSEAIRAPLTRLRFVSVVSCDALERGHM